MRTGFFTAALLAATTFAKCHGDNCENSFAQIADQVSGAAKENILAQVGKMLADMPEEYFETMEGMLAQIESGDVDAPQLLAQTAENEVHANLANLATMLSELNAEELAQVTSFMETNPEQIRDAFAPIIDDLAQVAEDAAAMVFPEDAPILSMSQVERENALADFLDQGADLLAQVPDADVEGLYDVFAESQSLALDWVDNLSPKSITAFENAYAQVKQAGINFFNSIKQEDKDAVTHMLTQTDYGQFAMAQIEASAPGLIDDVSEMYAQAMSTSEETA